MKAMSRDLKKFIRNDEKTDYTLRNLNNFFELIKSTALAFELLLADNL